MHADRVRDLISSASRPLAYLREADPTQRSRTRLPVASWLERIERLRPGAPALDELAEIFRRLGRDEERQQLELVERALVLLDELGREAGPAAATAAEAQPEISSEEIRRGLAALGARLGVLPGVGPAREAELERFGLKTVEDVLYHLPFRYDDRRSLAQVRSLRIGEASTLVVTLVGLAERSIGRARRVLQAAARDDSGTIELVWYHQLRYFRSRLKPGSRWLVHGRVERGYEWPLRIVHPELEAAAEEDAPEHASPRVVPVYEKPTAMPASTMRRIVRGAVRLHAGDLADVLPAAVRRRLALHPLADAFRRLHEPGPEDDPILLGSARSPYHRAIVFDELFFVQLGLLLRKRQIAGQAGIALAGPGELSRRMIERLPFELTSAQKRVLAEIEADMKLDRPMHRLLQGDVGSGKTVIGVAAALRAIEAGHQAALMAPTELLTEQHWRTVQQIAGDVGVALWMLTGQTPAAERRPALAELAEGRPGLVVGTHALIQDQVRFGRLGLVVIDEQHRFGVLQRAALSRGDVERAPDVLLMTATPIPRTLALSVYGDLDLSMIDELPPSRRPVTTQIYPLARRARAYSMVRRELEAGRQAYVVLPLIEESEKSDLRDATSAAQELASEVFSDFKVALVHGRMPSSERDAVMRAFRAKEHHVLVATTVIEVGLDVSNATVMVVEHAERFGLSQLHQLRGRVGRGSAASYCFLLVDYAQSNDARERLKVMTETNDGLRIAEADLEIRGPGAILGTRQAGLPDFRIANLLRDNAILREARAAAEEMLASDPTLSSQASQAVAQVLEARWAGRLGLARVG